MRRISGSGGVALSLRNSGCGCVSDVSEVKQLQYQTFSTGTGKITYKTTIQSSKKGLENNARTC